MHNHSKMVRKQIYRMIETANGSDKISAFYDYTMMAVIIASLIPLAFKSTNPLLTVIDRLSVSIFIIDYLLRWITADLKLGRGWASFFVYPFIPPAIIDFLCILPFFVGVAVGLRLLKIFRLVRTFRVFRTAKFFRYSKSLHVISRVIQKQKAPLIAVCTLAVSYVLISALVVFNVEPDTFNSFFDAVYWATVSLTTVGYGDIYPVTIAGRIITMISSLMGIAIVALPAGIITAGYMEEINGRDK